MRKKRKSPVVSSGSMADIAFLLLIFFMVVTTMQREESLSMRLPPAYEGPVGQIAENRVIDILINGDNDIMIEDELIHDDLVSRLKSQIKIVLTEHNKPYVNIRMHPDANYQNYTTLLSSVKLVLFELKSEYAQSHYSKSLKELNTMEKAKLKEVHNIKITEFQIEQL